MMSEMSFPDGVNNDFIELKKRLKGKIVLVGIGNRFRGDDGAGPELVKSIKSTIEDFDKRIQSSIPSQSFNLDSKLVLMDVHEVPENYLGKIIEYEPDTIVLVDAVDFGYPPGTIRILHQDVSLAEGLTTHNSSLELTMRYLKEKTNAFIFLLGIQPGKIKMNMKISKPVIKAIKQIEKWIIDGLNLM
jgi:hydrogenase 3 maturation protease